MMVFPPRFSPRYRIIERTPPARHPVTRYGYTSRHPRSGRMRPCTGHNEGPRGHGHGHGTVPWPTNPNWTPPGPASNRAARPTGTAPRFAQAQTTGAPGQAERAARHIRAHRTGEGQHAPLAARDRERPPNSSSSARTRAAPGRYRDPRARTRPGRTQPPDPGGHTRFGRHERRGGDRTRNACSARPERSRRATLTTDLTFSDPRPVRETWQAARRTPLHGPLMASYGRDL